MTIRRSRPLILAAVATIVVACAGGGATDLQTVPYGFLTFVARQAATGYTASPTGTFYSASGLGVPTATDPWDSCRVQAYSPTSGSVGLGAVYASMNAGPLIQLTLPGRVDSLFPAVVGTETQYLPHGSIPYTPGDSVSVIIPGASGALGYPGIVFKGKTAEAFVVQDFGTPVVGSNIQLRWTPGHDLNSTMVFSFRYTTPGSPTLNSQVYCQFRDNGTDSIPTRYTAGWVAGAQRTWVASRIRTYVAPVSKSGYFDFISTFDIPTPASP